MLEKHRLMAFVATTKPNRAKAFYRDVLGLQLVGDEPFALVFDAHGTMLRVSKVDSFEPAPFTVLGWEVPEVREAVKKLVSRGVAFQRYPGMLQDDLGIWQSPGGAQIAWFKDPDGNTLSLTEFKTKQ
jgi:catechol 2,3-dioxygenase-like lactoylglutathione lyase family enzyme